MKIIFLFNEDKSNAPPKYLLNSDGSKYSASKFFGHFSFDFSAFIRIRPALPFRVVNQRIDYNRQPHVIQRYHVPSPQNDQYCRHDQAVYSMWMHFAIFCSMELDNANSHRLAEAEIAAFAHPGYKYPLESNQRIILPFTPKGYQSNNVHTSHQQCFLFEGTLAVNPFTNVNRLDVFRNLSCGSEGSQSMFSTRESISCLSKVSFDSAATQASSPSQVSLDEGVPTELAYLFPRYNLRPHFNSEDLTILNPHGAICQPHHLDISLGNNLRHNSKRFDIEEHSVAAQQSNLLSATNYPYFNEKVSAASAIGLGCKATHLNHIVLSRKNKMTSFTIAGAVPKSSFLSHFEQSRISECEMGKITSLNAGNCAFKSEEKCPFDMDDERKRSLYDLVDFEENCPFFNISRMSTSEDSVELSFCDLTDNHLSFLPVVDGTPEMKSPINFEKASPTDISNVGSYSPSSVCNILRGSSKNIQSMDFKSRHRQGRGKEKQI